HHFEHGNVERRRLEHAHRSSRGFRGNRSMAEAVYDREQEVAVVVVSNEHGVAVRLLPRFRGRDVGHLDAHRTTSATTTVTAAPVETSNRSLSLFVPVSPLPRPVLLR